MIKSSFDLTPFLHYIGSHKICIYMWTVQCSSIVNENVNLLPWRSEEFRIMSEVFLVLQAKMTMTKTIIIIFSLKKHLKASCILTIISNKFSGKIFKKRQKGPYR